MEPSRKRYEQDYAARGYQSAPAYDVPPRKKKAISKATRRNREKALAFSLVHMVIMAFAMVITLGMCISYLSIQTKVTAQTKDIAQKEKELNNLLDENDSTKERLSNSIDLDYIYKVATKQLGMVYASDKQVIYYESSQPDYVKQYKDIPQAE